MDASVIIPALNAEETIGRAVRSAMNQTLQAIEILVVDDGSSDRTAAIVADLSAADPRVRLLRHAERRGVSAARNTAVQAASGEWLAVLDADDWFAPGRLADLVEHGRSRGLDAVIDNLTTVDASTGEVLGHAFPASWMTTAQPVRVSLPMELDIPYRGKMGFGYCKPIFRRSAFLDSVGRYDERFHCAEDILALQLFLFRGRTVATVESAGYFYSIDTRSLSKQQGASLDVSNVNRLITREAKRRELWAIVPLLKERQIVLDYDSFAKFAQKREIGAAMVFLRRLPLGVVAMQIARIVARRLGIDLGKADPRNPAWGRTEPSCPS